jgi:hypothetical protein
MTMTDEPKPMTVAEFGERIMAPILDEYASRLCADMTRAHNRWLETLTPEERADHEAEVARREALTPEKREQERISEMVDDLDAEYATRRASIEAGNGDPRDDLGDY